MMLGKLRGCVLLLVVCPGNELGDQLGDTVGFFELYEAPRGQMQRVSTG